MNNLFFFIASFVLACSFLGFNQQRSYANSYEDDSVMQETMLNIPDSLIQGKASFYGSEFNGRKTE
jgi:hypothetical protein